MCFDRLVAGGGLAGDRQKVFPRARAVARCNSISGWWGTGLAVRKVKRLAHVFHISAERTAAATSQSEALPRSAVQSLIALKRGHHHMARSTLKEGTPGYISAPRSVRPRPSITWRRGSAVSGIASRADIKSQVSMSQPLFVDPPLPTWVQLLPTELPGALHRGRWPIATTLPVNVQDGHRACESCCLVCQGGSRTFRTAGPHRNQP